MSKRTQTEDVFDRLDELDDSGSAEPDAAQPTSESDVADIVSDDEAPASDADTTDGRREDHETADTRPSRRLRRRMAVVLVGVALVASLGSSAFVGWRLITINSAADAGRAALAAARDYAVTLTTLDSKDIDKHYQRALDGATGKFKDEYSQGSAQLRQVLIDNKAAAKGIVIDAAVKTATKTKVEVLLFVDQSVTNAVNPSPRIDRNRVQMTMELVDNRWLASKVEIV